MKHVFCAEDWPNDGTDWDGVHDDTMEQILQNLEDSQNLQKILDVFEPYAGSYTWNIGKVYGIIEEILEAKKK